MTTTTDPLVSTEWLAAHLNDPDVKVIDASFKMPGVLPLPKDDYLATHIPGAVFFDVDAVSDHSNPLPHMFPSAEQFGRDVGGLGIGNDDVVVLYDSGGWVAAPRVWWMFLSFGKDVRILIQSVDVIHSLYIPEFRVKMDAVPGRYTELWFKPTQEGTFPIYCNLRQEDGCRGMRGELVVHGR